MGGNVPKDVQKSVMQNLPKEMRETWEAEHEPKGHPQRKHWQIPLAEGVMKKYPEEFQEKIREGLLDGPLQEQQHLAPKRPWPPENPKHPDLETLEETLQEQKRHKEMSKQEQDHAIWA